MQKTRVRPDPVSCESCRSKKLKCNRVQPCSNCSARGITCKFLVKPTNDQSVVLNSEYFLARLERLEKTINSLEQQFRAGNQNRSFPSTASYHDNLGYCFRNESNEGESQDDSLENIGVRDNELLCNMSGPLGYEIRPLSDILDPILDECASQTIGRTIKLPPFEVASLLLQTYETTLVVLCPIVHIPTIRSLARTTYLKLCTMKPISVSDMALLLSLFALGAFFSDPSPTSVVAKTEAGSIALSKSFSRGALDALDHSRRSGSGTLADVQAYLLMSLALSHIDGFSTRSRMLFSSAIAMARDLRLHRIDEAHEPATVVRAGIDREVKRRVFWYMASEDWLQSTISGPQEGTYWINTSQIKVNLPRDCTDDELSLGEPYGSVSSDVPSHMIVFLERIRLAHICREITDTVPLDTNALLRMPYEQIITLDQKLENFLNTMPPFLRHDCPNRKLLESIYTQLPSWSYCIAKSALSRRWKLNQRFLLRQDVDARYAYSRRVCVQSARAVIKGYAHLVAHRSASALLTRMGMAVHFTHLALNILIMDLCFNREQEDRYQIKKDIRAAFMIFEEAPTVSPLLAKSLKSLKAVLQKHEISLEGAGPTIIDMSCSTSGTPSLLPYQSLQSEREVTVDTAFDSFWDAALQTSSDINLDGWDDLFSTFDNRPI